MGKTVLITGNGIDMFGKDFAIEQIASERIRFIELEEAVASDN